MSRPKATYSVCGGGDGTAASSPFEGPRDVGSGLLSEVPELFSNHAGPQGPRGGLWLFPSEEDGSEQGTDVNGHECSQPVPGCM